MENVKNHRDIDFNDIYDTQAAKPEILRRVLTNAEHQFEHDVTVALKKNGFARDDVEGRLLKAEQQYHAMLNKRADYNDIAKAFERLPADRKIDLLEQAETISITNEQLRADAKAHMQASRTAAIAKYEQEQEIARIQEAAWQEQMAVQPTPKTEPTTKDAVKAEQKWPVFHITKQSLEQASEHYKYKPSSDQNARYDATHENDYIGNFSAITFNYIPSKALPLVLTARVGMGVQEDQTGHQHLALKLTYVGAGLSVNRNSNILFAPTGIKVPDVPLDGFGTLSTVLNRAAKGSDHTKGQMHHHFNPGTKVTLSTDEDARKVFAAPEVSYQKGGNRTIALTTAGYHWSKLGVSIAAEPVQHFIEKNMLDIKVGTLPQWADANLYNMQDLAIVGERMGKSLGSVNLYATGAEAAIKIIKRPTEILAEKTAELTLAIDRAIPDSYQQRLPVDHQNAVSAELAGLHPDQRAIVQARIQQCIDAQVKNKQAQFDVCQPTQTESALSQHSQSHGR